MKIPPKTAWVPDWKDKTHYPEPAAISARLWAWEFLRRGPKYRSCWETLILPDLCNNSFIYKDFHLEDTWKLFEQDFGIRNPPPPWLSSEELLIDMPGHPLFIRAARVELKPLDWPEDEDPYTVETELAVTEALVRIDLRFPLARQFEQAKSAIEARIKTLDEAGEGQTRRRNRPESYASYLRLLDAEEQGALPTEMGSAIFPEVPDEYPDHNRKRMVENGIKRAKALRDHHYRCIAAMAET